MYHPLALWSSAACTICRALTNTQRVMQAFERGFRMLCTGPALHLFSATELERLVCGNPILDFAALQKSARYEGGYAADHKVRAGQWTRAQRSVF